MPNRLNVPQDLDALIEKRDTEDRRQEQENSVSKERRSGTDRREEEADPPSQ